MDIPIWFLVLSLVLPRITLLIAWFSESIPANNIPFFGDFLMAVFIPRVLILIYIATNMGFNPWFWIHLVFMVLSIAWQSVQIMSSRCSRRNLS